MRYGAGAGNRFPTGFLIVWTALVVITASFPTAAAGGTRADQEEGIRFWNTRAYPPKGASNDELNAAKIHVFFTITGASNDGADDSDWYSTTTDIEQQEKDWLYDFPNYVHEYGEWAGTTPTITEATPGIVNDCEPADWSLSGGASSAGPNIALSVSWSFDWCGQWDIEESGTRDVDKWKTEYHHEIFTTQNGQAGYDFDVNAWGSSAEVSPGKYVAILFTGVMARCDPGLLGVYCDGEWGGMADQEGKFDYEDKYFRNYEKCFFDENGDIICGSDDEGEGNVYNFDTGPIPIPSTDGEEFALSE